LKITSNLITNLIHQNLITIDKDTLCDKCFSTQYAMKASSTNGQK